MGNLKKYLPFVLFLFYFKMKTETGALRKRVISITKRDANSTM